MRAPGTQQHTQNRHEKKLFHARYSTLSAGFTSNRWRDWRVLQKETKATKGFPINHPPPSFTLDLHSARSAAWFVTFCLKLRLKLV
jgi:hypothetical protein